MVFVNSKKFACESCIKGHRSSSCHHTDRPLFEIKKKGRPVSQCTKCRELRQLKKLHSKCTCNHSDEGTPAVQPIPSSSTKPRRFIPIVPALPNGLKDVLSQSSMTLPPDSRQRVDSLLNPCDCKSVWRCKCKQSNAAGSSIPEPRGVPHSMDALTTLASAAAAIQRGCCTPSSSTSSAPPPAITKSNNRPQPRSRPGTPSQTSRKRQRHEKTPTPMRSPGPDLAPILYTPSSSSVSRTSPTPVPDFGFMPPMSEITSLAGSGCTCGVQCACPGCVEHRGSDGAGHGRRDCAHGCGTCVDPSLGAALPVVSAASSSSPPGASNSSSSSSSFLDRFFARAAALPAPPAHRMMSSYQIDPMNTTLYPTTQGGSQPFGFGLVNLPKLECCGGQCHCPSGQCSCRTSCVGCCADKDKERQSSIEVELETTPLPARTCCAGKALSARQFSSDV